MAVMGKGVSRRGLKEASGVRLLSVAGVSTGGFSLWNVTELHLMICVPFP